MNAAHYMYKKELAKIEKMIPDLDGAMVTKPDTPLNNLCDEIFNELDYIVKKGMILFKTILETAGVNLPFLGQFSGGRSKEWLPKELWDKGFSSRICWGINKTLCFREKLC